MAINYDSFAILPCGKLNTKTGKTEFGIVGSELWEESTFIVCRESLDPWDKDKKPKIKVVSTSGNGTGFVVGDHIFFQHDQTRRSIGDGWEIIELVATKDFAKLQKYGTAVGVACFK